MRATYARPSEIRQTYAFSLSLLWIRRTDIREMIGKHISMDSNQQSLPALENVLKLQSRKKSRRRE